MSDVTERRAIDFSRFNFNTWLAVGFTLLGILILILIPSQIAEPPRLFGRAQAGISPKLIPTLLAICMIVSGAIYFLASFKLIEVNDFVSLDRLGLGNVAAMVAVMVLYVSLLVPLGFVLASILVSAGLSLWYGSRNPIGIFLVSVVMPLAIYFTFTRLLSVVLPAFPWGQA